MKPNYGLTIVKDFPVKGVNFIDINGLLNDPACFQAAIDKLCALITENIPADTLKKAAIITPNGSINPPIINLLLSKSPNPVRMKISPPIARAIPASPISLKIKKCFGLLFIRFSLALYKLCVGRRITVAFLTLTRFYLSIP